MKAKKSGFNPTPGSRKPGTGKGSVDGRVHAERGQSWSVGQPLPQGKKGGRK